MAGRHVIREHVEPGASPKIDGITLNDGGFVHRCAPLDEDPKPTKAKCGEAQAAGFRIASEEEFRCHPCPDCLRREPRS